MAVNVGQRNIKDTPQNRQLNACYKAYELCVHTVKICSNENIFLPEYKFVLTDEIVRIGRDIYINVWRANNIVVSKDGDGWSKRSSLQKQAISDCNALIALMQVARSIYHLKGKKVQYWQNLCLDVV